MWYGIPLFASHKRRTHHCELGIPVADEEPKTTPGVFEVGGEVAGHLGNPGAIWVGRDAEQVDSATFDLDHKEHIENAAA